MSAVNQNIPAASQPEGIYQTRLANVADLPQLVEVLSTSFYPASLLNHWFYWVMKLGLHEDLKRRLQSSNPRYRCLVAVRSGGVTADRDTPSIGQTGQTGQTDRQVAGTVEISFRPCQAWRLFPPHRLYLSNLAVRPDCRRTGVAQQLLATCEQIATEWGCYELYLHVMENNEAAQSLYRKNGYQRCEVGNPVLAALGLRPKQLLLSKQILS